MAIITYNNYEPSLRCSSYSSYNQVIIHNFPGPFSLLAGLAARQAAPEQFYVTQQQHQRRLGEIAG